MVCTLIDRRDDVKTQVEPLACGSWFHFKVLNILTSLIRVWIMGNKNIVFDLFFTITLPVFDVHFRWKFSITKITLARREIAPRPLGVIYSSGPSARDKSIFPSLTLRLQAGGARICIFGHIFIMENLTDFRKTVKTGMDPRPALLHLPVLL